MQTDVVYDVHSIALAFQLYSKYSNSGQFLVKFFICPFHLDYIIIHFLTLKVRRSSHLTKLVVQC